MIHPLLVARARQQAASAYSKEHKVSFLRALRTVRSIDEGDMHVACLQAAEDAVIELPTALMIGSNFSATKLGDGTIINAIIEWLKSPEGKAFIAALLKILLAMLAFV